jgi:hypothetical protein
MHALSAESPDNMLASFSRDCYLSGHYAAEPPQLASVFQAPMFGLSRCRKVHEAVYLYFLISSTPDSIQLVSGWPYTSSSVGEIS